MLAAGALLMASCGTGEVLGPPDIDSDDPLIQIHSEGGFVPVDWNLGRGPIFTVTQGGLIIYQGVTTLEYPGRLVPPYMAGQLNEEQLSELRQKLEAMGIAEIEDEHDDSVTNVADATTEVIRFWDESGVHRYSVYALGITDHDVPERTVAFADLFEWLHTVTGTIDASPYEADRVQVIAGADYQGIDPDFVDIRDWPLDGENPDNWDELTTVGEAEVWTCKVFDGGIPEVFEDATQATLWTHPSESADAQNYKLLVRALLPGEDGCSL